MVFTDNEMALFAVWKGFPQRTSKTVLGQSIWQFHCIAFMTYDLSIFLKGARNHVFVMHVDAKDEDHSRSNASTEAVHPSSIATLGMIEVDTLCTPENQATMASKSSLPSYSNYRCEICQINFSEEANLLQHQLSKHGEFDISKHKLGNCDRTCFNVLVS